MALHIVSSQVAVCYHRVVRKYVGDRIFYAMVSLLHTHPLLRLNCIIYTCISLHFGALCDVQIFFCRGREGLEHYTVINKRYTLK